MLLSGDHAKIDRLAKGAGPLRNPIDYLTEGLPHGWRVTIDWLVTIVGAIVIVLAIKAWVVNPYRIPSSSMEPTLHCARPGPDCEASYSDRVLACRFCYRFWSPQRGDIIVFKTPPLAALRCGAGGTFVKRLIGLPGRHLGGARRLRLHRRQAAERAVHQAGPARRPHDRADEVIPKDQLLHDGRQPQSSCDSRSWGTVPRKNLIGKVFATYWPPNRISIQ